MRDDLTHFRDEVAQCGYLMTLLCDDVMARWGDMLAQRGSMTTHCGDVLA